MYEHLVRNVTAVKCGYWTWALKFEGRPDGMSDGAMYPRTVELTEPQIGAIETWLAQPRPMTIEQHVERVVQRISRDVGLGAEPHVLEKVKALLVEEMRAVREEATER